MRRATRAALTVVVLCVLVVGLVVGLVELSGRLWGPGAGPVTARCVADVPDPAVEGGRLRAELAPDQAGSAALVAGLAQQRGLPARAATIGIATAIQESGLRNIDYGDRDSLGLFQQRPSQGWGTPEQVQDPVYATNAFYDGLVRVDGYAELEVTVAAQRVQRSGFPDAYADHEGEGRALASSLYGLSEAALWCELLPLEGLVPETPDQGGLTPRARALVVELGRWGPGGWEASPAGVAATTGEQAGDGDAADDGPGATVLLDASRSSEPGATAWSLAQTVVASADTLAVLRVEVDGQVWHRDADEPGWQPVDQPGAPTGTVLVEVG